MGREARDIRSSKAEQAAELESLSQRLERLRVAFDRFFMGLERVPPVRDREALERDVRRSPLTRVRHTATRFKYQNLQQRLVTYGSYWDRIMRMIEEGTFRREKAGAMAPPPGAGSNGSNGSKARGDDAERGGMQALYESWHEARKAVGIDKSVSFDKFRAKMEATREKHLSHFSCREIQYGVKVKNGKVSLTAKPIY